MIQEPMKNTTERALKSLGTSDPAIYRRVAELLAAKEARGAVIADVGCGTGALRPFLRERFARYVGVDVVRHEGFPADAEFRQVDLDTGRIQLEDGSIDAAISVETIEHLENPRAFVRELARILKPGGALVVTTPNQLSLLSKATLLFKNRFNAFQEPDYPAHLTALLEIDLVRIARESGLVDVGIEYSRKGRIILSSRRFPGALSRAFPRALSDTVLLFARKPGA